MDHVIHVYTRISSIQQEGNTSLEQQRDAGQYVADRLGMKTKLWDEGVASSYGDDIEDRPVLAEMMSQVQDGQIKRIFVEYTDRLSRNQKSWSAIRFLLERHEVKLYTASSTEPLDLQDPTDELILAVLSAINIFENKQRKNRMTTGRYRKIEENKWHGGAAPFGYRIEEGSLVVDEHEGKWVDEIFKTYAETRSIQNIRLMLRENNVKTRRGKTIWSSGSVEKLLTNTHYDGHYSVNKYKTRLDKDGKKIKEVIDTFVNECPSILDADVSKQVREILTERSNQNRTRDANLKHDYLLRKRMKCSCGYTLTPLSRKNQNFYYCPVKEREWRSTNEDRVECAGLRRIPSDVIDDRVWEIVVSVLENSNLYKETMREDVMSNAKTWELSRKELDARRRRKTSIQKEIKLLKETITNLRLSNLTGKVEKDEFSRSVDVAEKQIRELQTEKDNIVEEIDRSKRHQKWIDWVGDFDRRIGKLRHTRDFKERSTLLDDLGVEIVVSNDDTGGTNHALTIDFNVPYVGDEFRWNDSKNKSKMGYQLIDGSKTITADLVPKMGK
jgi:site-specific DNA recombinase